MKSTLRMFLVFGAVMALLAVGTPVSAHDTHSSMDFTCADPDPKTKDTPSKASCSFDFNDNGDFGNTNNDKVNKFELWLPAGATVNEDNDQGEDGSDGVADPADGDDVGTSTVTTELSYNNCDDNNTDGGTYITEWDNDWNSYSESGWDKVAEYNTKFTVLFITINVPSHVMKRQSDGQYKVVTDLPQDSACAGAHTTFNPLVTYAYANDNSNNTWIAKNPNSDGCFTVTLVAYEVGGTTHTDTDQVEVGSGTC